MPENLINSKATQAGPIQQSSEPDLREAAANAAQKRQRAAAARGRPSVASQQQDGDEVKHGTTIHDAARSQYVRARANSRSRPTSPSGEGSSVSLGRRHHSASMVDLSRSEAPPAGRVTGAADNQDTSFDDASSIDSGLSAHSDTTLQGDGRDLPVGEKGNTRNVDALSQRHQNDAGNQSALGRNAAGAQQATAPKQGLLHTLNKPMLGAIKKMFPNWKSETAEIVAGVATVGSLIAFAAICFSNPVTGSALLGVSLLAGAGVVGYVLYAKFKKAHQRVNEENHHAKSAGMETLVEDERAQDEPAGDTSKKNKAASVNEQTAPDVTAQTARMQAEHDATVQRQDAEKREQELHDGHRSHSPSTDAQPNGQAVEDSRTANALDRAEMVDGGEEG